jgi:predicted transcriptional regulator
MNNIHLYKIFFKFYNFEKMMENELDEINTDSHKKNPSITKPTNPEEVLKFIEEHEKKSNNMIDQGHDLIKKIKEMNKEISSEIQAHNILISKLDNNMTSANENLKKNSNKIEEILKKTSSYSLVIAMIIQVIVILFLIFI